MDSLLFHLDSNSINARQNSSALNALERLANLGRIQLEYSEVAQNEASQGNGSGKRKRKAEQFISSGLSGQAEFEAEQRIAISKIIFPHGCLTAGQKKDVEIVLTAWMCNAILVTSDGASKSQPRGILGSKADLANINARVMSPAEALAYATEHLRPHESQKA